MDFRENWLAHFRAAVEQEIKAAHGDDAAGYRAVAAKLEKTYATVYQHYKQKSGKVYPTVEMMVMLEKKYGAGRSVGWSSQNASDAMNNNASHTSLAHLANHRPISTIPNVVKWIADGLKDADETTRKMIGEGLAGVAREPLTAEKRAAELEKIWPSNAGQTGDLANTASM